MLRRSLALASALWLLAAGAAAARGSAPVCAAGCTAAPAGSGPLFVLTGHGWGHGVGLSQYGAYGYAQHGWTYDEIVSHYYPGTTLGPAGVARVRVLLAERRTALTIGSTLPFRVRDGFGETYELAAGSYKLGPALKLKVGAGPAQPLQPPLTFSPAGAPLQLGRAYRGSIEVDVIDRRLRAIDVVGLEQYLWGVVPAEMPSTWAPEALKTQAVVARSYALATRNVAAPYDLYADTRSQVYLGVSAERTTTTTAVNGTAGQVVLYGAEIARTYFFSTSGGRTANATDVWSGPPTPYLVSVSDPYDAISPYHDWGPFPFTGVKLAKTFKLAGRVTDVRADVTASGRVSTLELVGTQGAKDVPATKVRSALKLRSTWFDVGVLTLARVAPVKPVEYGAQVQLTGLSRGLAGVSLEQRPLGSGWQAVEPVAARADGAVSLTAKPAVTTDYRLATEKLAAAPVRVSVMPRVRFYGAARSGDLRGFVRPVLPGASVQIQRQDVADGPWTTLTTTAVDANGDFAATLDLTAGVYRARVSARGFAAGTTPPLRVVSG